MDINIDICLIHSPVYELKDQRLEPPLGLLYLATYLRQYGIKAKICDLSGIPKDEWEIPFASYYGFSTYSTTYNRTLEIKNIAKTVNPKAITIAGGPHASAMPSQTVNEFDYVVVGEGEIALKNIIEKKHCKGIVFGDSIIDLDSMPFPDYSLINIDSYTRKVAGKRSFSIQSSRGCPHQCIFCNSVVMGGHKKPRIRSPKNVIREMALLKKNYGDVNFRFQDDLFASDFKWLKDFSCEAFDLDIKYRAFVRADRCAIKNYAYTLYSGGCRHVSIGVESGSDKILKIAKKGSTAKEMEEGIKACKKANLIVRIYLIVGLPGETWDTIKETVDFCKRIQPDEFVVYPLIPYPGTELFYFPEKYGIINIDKDYHRYFQIYGEKQSHFVFDYDGLDRHEMQRMKELVERELDKISTWAVDSKKGYR